MKLRVIEKNVCFLSANFTIAYCNSVLVIRGLLRRKGCRILGKKVKLEACSKVLNMMLEIRLGQALAENHGKLS